MLSLLRASSPPPAAARAAAPDTTPARSITLSLVGDRGAGKSTLVMTLVSKQFAPVVPSVVPQICVSPDAPDYKVAVRLKNIFIRDCALGGRGEEDLAALAEQLSSSDGVIVVHALDDPQSFERVKAFWLPQVTARFKGPIVVCGSKHDLVAPPPGASAGGDAADQLELESRVRPLIESFPQVDSCVEVSAMDIASVENLFYLAQHSVMYPVAPLFDVRAKRLTKAFEAAITRVFRFFDRDGDHLLSDSELNNFQEQSFDARLPVVDLEGLKAVLANEAPGYVTEGGVTLDGLKFLFQLFIRRGLPESSWQVLHRFGYNDVLEFVMKVPVFPKTQSVELSKKSMEFLTKVLQEFDADHDGALSSEDLVAALQGCPDGRTPWTDISDASTRALSDLSDFPQGCLTNRNGHLTLAGWLGFWHMLTLLSPGTSLRFLTLMSFPEDSSAAFKVVPRSAPDKHVVRVFVFGARGVGKSSLLDALVRKTAKGVHHDTPRSAVAAVRPKLADRPSSYLVLTEVPASLAHSTEALGGFADCDLAVMLFDSTNPASVDFLAQVQTKVPSHVPCVYWGTKEDLLPPTQTSDNPPAAFVAGCQLCQAYSLPEPTTVRLRAPEDGKWQDFDKRFELLVETARYPKAAQPVTIEQKRALEALRWRRMTWRLSLVSVTLAAVSYAGFFLLRRTSTANSASPRRVVDA